MELRQDCLKWLYFINSSYELINQRMNERANDRMKERPNEVCGL